MAVKEPWCKECGTFLKLREDGTLPNHRDADGVPCAGSRQAPGFRKGHTRTKGFKPRAHAGKYPDER